MRIGDAIGDIGIGLAEDMRHAEIVADDLHVIFARRRGLARFGHQRFPHRKGDGGYDDKDEKAERQTFKDTHGAHLINQSARVY